MAGAEEVKARLCPVSVRSPVSVRRQLEHRATSTCFHH